MTTAPSQPHPGRPPAHRVGRAPAAVRRGHQPRPRTMRWQRAGSSTSWRSPRSPPPSASRPTRLRPAARTRWSGTARGSARRSTSTSTPGSTPRNLKVELGLRLDPLSAVMVLVITGVGTAHPHLHDRLHGQGPGVPPLLRLPQPVHRRDADPGARHQPAGACSSAGRASGCARTCSSGSGSTNDARANAGRKAFIVNRIGDFAFLSACSSVWVLNEPIDCTALDPGLDFDALRSACAR